MTPFQGRLLHVLPAKRKPGEDLEDKPDKEVSSAGTWLLLSLGFAPLGSKQRHSVFVGLHAYLATSMHKPCCV